MGSALLHGNLGRAAGKIFYTGAFTVFSIFVFAVQPVFQTPKSAMDKHYKRFAAFDDIL